MLSDEEFRRTLRRALRLRVHEGVAPQRAIGKALAAHSAAEQRAGASHSESEEFRRELAIADAREQTSACLWQQVEAVRGNTAEQLRLALTEPDAASRAPDIRQRGISPAVRPQLDAQRSECERAPESDCG